MVKTTRGIIPFIYNISDKEIAETIRKFREDVSKGNVIPPDYLKDKSDEGLRPFAINTILLRRRHEQAKHEMYD